ncbi:MAG: hypothetical protein NPIRA06_21560 [Nitrospirales bacterium]|nr:MAG: hypothetical protein NPIRA06_21560 [Nitrospirales bacterium]
MPYNPAHRIERLPYYQIIDLLKETGKVEEGKFRSNLGRSIGIDTDCISFAEEIWLFNEHVIQDVWMDRIIGLQDSL